MLVLAGLIGGVRASIAGYGQSEAMRRGGGRRHSRNISEMPFGLTGLQGFE